MAGVLALASPVGAQSPESRPLLERLNVEVQSLYGELQGGVVRVQLPAPRVVAEAADKANPLDDPAIVKNLDPQTIAVLKAQREAIRQGQAAELQIAVNATTQPATAPATSPAHVTEKSGWRIVRKGDTMVMEPIGGGEAVRIDAGGARGPNGELRHPKNGMQMGFAPAGNFAPNNVGLLLDHQGHFLVPQYVEKDRIGQNGIAVAIGDQQLNATFVGADRQSELTVLKLQTPPGGEPVGKPVILSQDRPASGALVMLLAPNRGEGKLVVWTDNVQDYGVVANIDGSVAGFVRYGGFFTARAAKPVVDQLIRTGRVQRAALGVRVAAVGREDPARQQNAMLANRPALRVEEVTPGSAADRKLAVGDMIFAIGDEPVGDVQTFAAFLSARQGKTAIQVVRGNQTEVVTVDLKLPKTPRPATTRISGDQKSE